MFALIFKAAIYVLLAFAGSALLIILKHRLRHRCLWKIPGPSNPSFVWGHWYHMFNPYAYPFHEGLYKTYGKVARVYGFLGDIQLVVSDPTACNNILIKDQVIFEETEAFLVSNREAFGPGLFSTLGSPHRKQRKLINPVFSISHMRYMIPIFHGVTRQLRQVFESAVADGPQEVNITGWMGKLALELIGEAGLGYSFGTLEGQNDQFCKALKEWVPTSSSLMVHRNLFPYVCKIFRPKVLKFLGKLTPWRKLNHFIELTEIMNANTRRIYEMKKKLLESGDEETVKQVEDGKDIISLLMKANVTASEGDRLSEEELLAQMTILVLAATDTTSSALSRILHILSLHPEAQEKLRNELKGACEANEELPYDQLVSLPYLDAVCRETLRLYAPVPGVMRTARSDVILPLSTPIHDNDGHEIHEIFVPNDTNVYVQIYNLNRDPSIWGYDAAEWKPERWLAPLPESVVEAKIQGVYANTMTFIGGARSCIGFKFSQLEMKVVLSQIIPAFRFMPSKAEIIWRFGGVSSPSVKGSVESFHPNLPIIILLQIHPE
ncbi:cytochrome P450 [Multifurca ochricompacta]|uniref:Cytochrome P450 n=1 Tax=Multifurca ochricompacta TaxID=376703 RepID=A0AAD4LYD1_9AGAM|nr:cytochrome P450 [Multifurca ochricompacta]